MHGDLQYGVEKTSIPDGEIAKQKEIQSTQEKSHGDRSVREAKDTKSFAQSLFNTSAIRSLDLGDVNDVLLRWTHSSASSITGVSSEEVNEHSNIKCNGTSHFGSSRDRENNNIDSEEVIMSELCSDTPSSTNDECRESSSLKPLNSDQETDGSSVTHFLSLKDGHLGSETPYRNRSHEELNNTSGSKASRPRSLAGPATIYMVSTVNNDGRLSGNVDLDKSSPENPEQGGTRAKTPSSKVQLALPSLPQSLSHFSTANIFGLMNTIIRKYRSQFQKHHFLRSRGRLDFTDHPSKPSSTEDKDYRAILAFSAQSMTYVLSNVEPLLKSFLSRDVVDAPGTTITPYPLETMVYCFRLLGNLDFHPRRVLPSLRTIISLVHPSDPIRTRARSIENNLSLLDDPQGPLVDFEASHIVKITFAALIATMPTRSTKVMEAVADLRRMGQIIRVPDCSTSPISGDLHKKAFETVMRLEDEMALDVAKRLVRAILARHQADPLSESEGDACFRKGYICQVVDNLLSVFPGISVAIDQAPLSLRGGVSVAQERLEVAENVQWPCRVIIEWLRTIIIKEWDGKALIRRCSAVGAAVQILSEIFRQKWVGIDDSLYQTSFLSDRLDLMEVPLEWMESNDDNTFVHLLSYPFLFPPAILYSYFRVINYDAMYKAFESAAMAENLMTRMTFASSRFKGGTERFQDQLRIAQTNYLVLEVRREDVLTDAMEQLWRRQKSELMKPLKVRMGLDEGEEGNDHGGVQQEFFRVAIAEALDSKYGNLHFFTEGAGGTEGCG